MKFDSKWFLGRLRLNFKPIFGNSEKGALGRGDSPKFSKILFINRFWWNFISDGYLPSQIWIWSQFFEILKKGVPKGGDSPIKKKNCLSTNFDEIWYYIVFWSPKTKSDVNFPKFSKGALRRGGGKFSKQKFSQPILIRFGTRWFFGLIKRKCK